MGVESKGSIKYPQLPDWIEDRADDIPSPLPISEGRMCGSTSLFGDGAIIESAVWRHLSAIKVCESVRGRFEPATQSDPAVTQHTVPALPCRRFSRSLAGLTCEWAAVEKFNIARCL